MIGKLIASDEVNGALVVALSGTIAVLVAKGTGPASFGRLLSGCLSNPIPRRESSSDVLAQAAERRAAA